MKAKIADQLTRFARARENAYRVAGSLKLSQLSAISKIKNVASMVQDKREEVQLRAVIRIESELVAIMPHPDSRFSKMRQRIESLINLAHERLDHQSAI